MIEGDIKGCFDNIDHQALLSIIRRDIRDDRLLRLIDGLLRAGYMEDWKYRDTTSGTPQSQRTMLFMRGLQWMSVLAH